MEDDKAKLTQAQRIFVISVAEGATKADAYARAYPKSENGNSNHARLRRRTFWRGRMSPVPTWRSFLESKKRNSAVETGRGKNPSARGWILRSR